MTSPDAPNLPNAQAAEASRLQELDVDVQDQDEIERDITRKVSFISHLILLSSKFHPGGRGSGEESRRK